MSIIPTFLRDAVTGGRDGFEFETFSPLLRFGRVGTGTSSPFGIFETTFEEMIWLPKFRHV
jgi:hypothetical protein